MVNVTMQRPRIPVRQLIPLVLSYAFDWILLIVIAGVSTVLGNIEPTKRPFSLSNLAISFPETSETIPLWILLVAAFVAPAVIIPVVCLIVVPGSTSPQAASSMAIWKRKLWEWHAGWLGLALSLAASWLITSCSKNLVGKARPDLIARCRPNLDRISDFRIGGFADLADGAVLVSAGICQNEDSHTLDDGWRSFPSGHASFSAAGLVYLSFFLATKFAVGVPFLANRYEGRMTAFSRRSSQISHSVQTYTDGNKDSDTLSAQSRSLRSARESGAGAPIYLLFIAIVPTLAAIYIALTRYLDFRHHGIDLFTGFVIGTLTSWFAFRYYHLPMSKGAGWAWGPRARDRAFWGGIGRRGHVDDDEDDDDDLTHRNPSRSMHMHRDTESSAIPLTSGSDAHRDHGMRNSNDLEMSTLQTYDSRTQLERPYADRMGTAI